MLLQTNSYIVPKERRAEHARLIRRFRQAMARIGLDQFEVYEQVGPSWSPGGANGRYVQIMRFRDRQHQQAVQAAEREDHGAQHIIAEFCELINFPYQQQHGYFATGFYTSVLPVGPRQAPAMEAPVPRAAPPAREIASTHTVSAVTQTPAAANIPKGVFADAPSESRPARPVADAPAVNEDPDAIADAEAGEELALAEETPEQMAAEAEIANSFVDAESGENQPTAELDGHEAVEQIALEELAEAKHPEPASDEAPLEEMDLGGDSLNESELGELEPGELGGLEEGGSHELGLEFDEVAEAHADAAEGRSADLEQPQHESPFADAPATAPIDEAAELGLEFPAEDMAEPMPAGQSPDEGHEHASESSASVIGEELTAEHVPGELEESAFELFSPEPGETPAVDAQLHELHEPGIEIPVDETTEIPPAEQPSAELHGLGLESLGNDIAHASAHESHHDDLTEAELELLPLDHDEMHAEEISAHAQPQALEEHSALDETPSTPATELQAPESIEIPALSLDTPTLAEWAQSPSADLQPDELPPADLTSAAAPEMHAGEDELAGSHDKNSPHEPAANELTELTPESLGVETTESAADQSLGAETPEIAIECSTEVTGEAAATELPHSDVVNEPSAQDDGERVAMDLSPVGTAVERPAVEATEVVPAELAHAQSPIDSPVIDATVDAPVESQHTNLLEAATHHESAGPAHVDWAEASSAERISPEINEVHLPAELSAEHIDEASADPLSHPPADLGLDFEDDSHAVKMSSDRSGDAHQTEISLMPESEVESPTPFATVPTSHSAPRAVEEFDLDEGLDFDDHELPNVNSVLPEPVGNSDESAFGRRSHDLHASDVDLDSLAPLPIDEYSPEDTIFATLLDDERILSGGSSENGKNAPSAHERQGGGPRHESESSDREKDPDLVAFDAFLRQLEAERAQQSK